MVTFIYNIAVGNERVLIIDIILVYIGHRDIGLMLIILSSMGLTEVHSGFELQSKCM